MCCEEGVIETLLEVMRTYISSPDICKNVCEALRDMMKDNGLKNTEQ